MSTRCGFYCTRAPSAEVLLNGTALHLAHVHDDEEAAQRNLAPGLE